MDEELSKLSRNGARRLQVLDREGCSWNRSPGYDESAQKSVHEWNTISDPHRSVSQIYDRNLYYARCYGEEVVSTL